MEIEEGRSRKKWIYLGGVQNHIFFLYHHCCRLRQLSSREVYTPDLLTLHFSLNVNTIQNVFQDLAQATKLRNANLEMQYKNRIKLRSIVKERTATEAMLPLTGLLLLYCDGFIIIVQHRKPRAGGGSHSCPATYNLHHAWMVEGGRACPSQDWAAVCCIDYKKLYFERE